METKKQVSKSRLWASYILQGIIAAMFLMGAATNLLKTEMAVSGAKEMGYAESSVPYLGVVLLISTLLYVFPKTIVLGAALLTAWLGGAVATHVINGDSITMVFAPVIFGVIVWLVVWLRSNEFSAFFPIKK